MFTIDPSFEARERSRRLQAEALAEQHRTPLTRRLLAEILRQTADRLDPGTIVRPLHSAHS